MKYLSKYIIGFILMFSFNACKRFVEVDPPNTKLSASSVFSGNQTATAAVLNLYANGNVQAESWNVSQYGGLLSDELNGTASQSSDVISYYSNQMNSLVSPGLWVNGYNYIYQANAVIEGLAGSSGVNNATKQQLTGEAKFYRAFWYFYLANLYGDVPVIISTDYKINSVKARDHVNLVYQQILEDLKDAGSLLSEHYVDIDDSSVVLERVRPTKWAAYSLLARCFLYNKEYDSAIYYSSLVLGNTNLFKLNDSLDDVFLKNSSEAIWQLQVPTPASKNTFDGYYFILISEPSGGNTNTATISSGLLNTFDSNDLRRTHWIGSYSDGNGGVYYFPYKYKQYYSSTVTEYTMMLRLAEQYLIRSEARVYKGLVGGAVADLNVIRNRSGLSSYPSDTSAQAVLQDVMKERRLELFCEWGHRWFDLIRTGAIDSVMSPVTPEKGGAAWLHTDVLFPIPFSELQADVRLVQNDGY